MICYGCNTSYPEQGPETFWICPECKGGMVAEPTPGRVSMYWSLNPREQDGFVQAYGPRPKPLTAEEKRDMEGCGA